MQRLCYACDEYSHQFFVNDHEHPYTFPPTSHSCGFGAGRWEGRRSVGRAKAIATATIEFKGGPPRRLRARTGHLSYKELEPYYDKVESFIGVSGSYEGLEQIARRQVPSANEFVLR